MTDMLLPLQTYEQSLIDYVNFYVEQNPEKTDAQARAYIQDILLGQHEFERRQVRYILGVPLSTKKIMQGKNGKLVSPAEYRNEIMRTITSKEWTNPNERIAALKKYKQDLIFLTDPKTKISGEHTVNNTKIGKISEGESYSKPNSDISKIPLDITDSFYDTSVLTYKAGREVRQEFDSLKQTNPQLYNMIKEVRDNMTIVQNETLKTNAVGNYAGPQVLNIIDFYGWENYIPLKSKRDKSIVDDDIAMAMEPTGRMSRELKKLEATFEGQQEDAEDPFTQTVVDASLAASRAGRVQYTQAIFNAVTTKINYKDAAGNPQTTTAIDGKIEGIFSYEDRYNNTEELQKAIQKPSTVIHFLPNGSLAVISIKDPKLLLAIRQSYTDSNFIIDRLNYVTGKIGQMHTRYNFKFGPINFIRDVITNFWIIGTDLGLADVAGYAQAVSEIVGKGGLQKTFVMVRMYNKGEKTKLKKYVNEQTKKGNTYPKDFLEYLQRGGMVAYKQALSTESVFREQQQMVKGTRTAKTSRAANNFFDAYMGMFELSSRVAAYQIFKKNYLARNAREALELLRNDILNSEASRLANYQLQLIDVLLNVPNLDNVKVDILTPLAMTNLAKKENISGVYTSNLNVNKQSTTISIVENLENSDTIKTFLHEAVHAATILKLGNLNLEEATVWRDILVKAREAAAQRGITKYEKQYYGLKDIKEFVAEAFTNEEFSNFLNTIDSINPQTETTFTSLFKDLVRAIKRLLNSDVDDTLLGDTIKFSTELFNVGAMPPASVRKINSIKATNSMENRIPREIIDILFPPETRTDPTALEGSGESKDKKERTSEQRRADMAEDNKQREKSAVRHTTSFIKNFFSNSQDYIDRVYKNFANAAGDLKKLQDYLESSNLLVRGVEGFNNIFDKLTLSHSIANDYMTDMLLPLQTYEQSLIDYVNFYVEQNPEKTDAQARAYIQDILLGQHEFERRQVRYILGVPLSTKKIMQGKNGKLVSPAEYRNEIMRTITSKEWTNPNERIAALKKYKQDLIFLTDPKTKISGEHTVNNTKIGKISEGESYSKPNSDISKIPLDITDSFYDTSVLTYKAGREVRQEFDSLKQTNPQLYNMIKEVRDNMTIVQNETLKTNAVGNYAGPQVLNIIDFYGWENYIPLKSKRDKSIVDDDIAMAMEPTGRMSRELKKLEATFEGQQEDAEDPFTQTVVDASLAASRAGRVQYTQAIFNAVTTKINYKDAAGNPQTTTAIDGKIEGIFSYEDRYNNTEELQKAIQKPSTVIHFLPNGSLAVISIKDPKLLLAIRQSYTDSNFIIDRLNYVTGKIGQMHTRYNFKFGPINFIRDVITNFWIIGTDLGLADVAGYAQAVSEIVGKGGLQKTFVMVRMYNKGEKTKLKKYVNEQTKKGNTYPKDFLEYLQRGGMVAYKQALSTESVFREQQQMVKGTRTAKTSRAANNFFDAYMGMFELSSRVAAYQIFKKNYLARNATGLKDSQVPADVMEAAKESATVYAKRLSNFEEVGNFGRDLGAFYMFFRASAVGAARALQSVGPGFRSAKAVEADLPQYIKGNPEALASFRKSFARKQERARGMMGVGIGFGLTLFYMSALLATGDDEDDTNKTLNDDLSRWTRFARFDISGITGNKNDVLQLPWGFGLGGFPAIGAQLGGLLSSNENSYQSILGNTIEITLDSFAPFPISRMDPTEAGVTWFFDSFSPTLLRPLFEYSINSNAFGSPIYNASRARYGSAYQSGDSVPAIYRDLTIAMSEATNGAIDFSPNSVYFFMNNYIDAVSTLTQNLYSFQLSARGKQDFNLKSDTILLGSFFSKYSELDQRAYASTIRKIDKLQAKVNLFKDVNPAKYLEVLEENPMALGIIKSYESMKAQLNKLNEQANIIRKQPNLTPKQRKYFLDEIKTMQLILKRQITAAVEMELED